MLALGRENQRNRHSKFPSPLPARLPRFLPGSLTFIDESSNLADELERARLQGLPGEPFMPPKPKLARNDSACCRTPVEPKLTRARAREYAEWFRALADPTRIRILNLLAANREPVCVCDIVKYFPIGQPTISHHLKILRDTRFVRAERHGTFMYYRVTRNCLGEFPGAARRIMDV
jgi:ArsR family transcriptional regulator, arsenate/arsenite/antimonite-responsive transcriptional repressor